MIDNAEQSAGDVAPIPVSQAADGAFSFADGPVRLLLVERSEAAVEETRRAFRSVMPQLEIDVVSSGEEAIRSGSAGKYDIAVIDYVLPDMDGLDLLHALADVMPIVMVASGGDERLAVRALRSGAEDYLVKEEGYIRRLPQAALGAIARHRLNNENKRLIAQTTRQASLLETVLTTDPGAVAVFRGPNFRLELASPAYRALFPFLDPEKDLGRPIDEIFPERRKSVHFSHLNEVFTTGKSYHFRDAAIPSTDGFRYFHVHMQPLNSGLPEEERGVAIIMWEITEEVAARRQVETLAKQTEAQRLWLQTVIDELPEGVYIMSSDGETLLVNRAAREILGTPSHTSVVDPEYPELFRLSYPDGTRIDLGDLPLAKAVFSGEKVVGQELRHTRPEGSKIDLLVNAAPVYDTDGNLTVGVAVFQDITKLKDIERLKDEFVSIASHELRTPLTAINAIAQIMLRTPNTTRLGEKEISSLNLILAQASRMARLVDEMLDVARLQSGKVQIQQTLFDLILLAREVLEAAQLASPTFTIRSRFEGRLVVRGDRDRMAQVLGNLLENAVKYSVPGGSADLSIEPYGGDGCALITIIDDGIGFEPEQSELIFDRFSRLASINNNARGLGLGLYICRQIVEAHGGTITARSEGPGRGSTFKVTLPSA